MGTRTPGSGPSSPDRRRLLLALGFGAANVAVLRALGSSADGDAEVSGSVGMGRRAGASTDPPALPGAADAPPAGHVFDTVISRGRVVDPATGFDDDADVGIDGTAVTALSREPLHGRTTIGAAGKVVAPGFIDLLSYEPNPYGIWFKIGDGVTTNLGMHGINATASDFFARFAAEGSPCHYGGAYDNPYMRGDGGLGLDSGRAAAPADIDRLAADVEAQIQAGWIGVDFEPEYTPGITFEEMRRQAEVAARLGVPVFVHGRYSDVLEPGTNRDTLREILDLARQTGAAVHVEHITSTGGTFSMAESLRTLQVAADEEGIDVTACMYPYTFWATYLGSPRFADGWQDRYDIGYDDLVIPGTGERLTEETFRRYQRENRLAAAFAIPEGDIRAALRSPQVMLGSDSILEPGDNNHPRAAGCFARTLGRYVREEAVIDLVDALAKMTIMPARRLEARAPALRRKGRLQRGADADICIFDPDTVGDRATLADPAQRSRGIEWVIVLGQVVQSPDGQHTDVRPGTPVTYGVPA